MLRDVSLPGLSDAMGVVRSGLNQPLNVLLDHKYITVRVAHAHRWRCSSPSGLTTSPKKGGHGFTTIPNPSLRNSRRSLLRNAHHAIIGRTQELEELTNLVEKHGHALLGGLSGVGKTTLLRAWSTNQSDAVRWATVDELAMLRPLWVSGCRAPARFRGTLKPWLSMSTLAVECWSWTMFTGSVNAIKTPWFTFSVRFATGVIGWCSPVVSRCQYRLIGRCFISVRCQRRTPSNCSAIISMTISDVMLPKPSTVIRWRSISTEKATRFPEAGADIQAFVEQTMLMDLSEDARDALDDMVLFPRPLPSTDILGSECLGELDERALLRWSSGNTEVEVQHLIRNVRRTMLDEERLGVLHRRAVEHWSERSDNPALQSFTSITNLRWRMKTLRKPLKSDLRS